MKKNTISWDQYYFADKIDLYNKLAIVKSFGVSGFFIK